ncbi:MAG: transcriptional repressor [Lentimicrobium sp.]|jgi:Fur family peroxide stress response transcriptional regulator|nr:transcriptional repressor [Lentimicrobium sp.]MDD2528057.1 Fur family transcriptional regulator [Lentimicrobiaceae bacterium]MDD4597686.1 Fur family transcriptional regulator [Lentimicrobiaceae bacterium]MDY0025554.1 Fur family transcriptional regulator [Lentimicrobium sp.]HAH57986.1 transcriptional repressor [Bacteroidales bacterium]
MKNRQEIINKLNAAGLKVTPQRMAVLQTLAKLKIHPTADELYHEVVKTIPALSATTIYNTLEIFVEKGLIKRVKTDAGRMRYDHIMEQHHHLYSVVSDQMEDYFNPELDALLQDYFDKNEIKGFKVNEIRLQISGEFDK